MGISSTIEKGEGSVETLAVLLNSLPPVNKVEITTQTKQYQYLFTHKDNRIDINVEGSRVTLNPDDHIKWAIHSIDI